jgi:two-component system, response regulator / RNA-binding antiterminator
LRVLLLHDTQHDLPTVESVLAAEGFVVRSVAVDALTLQAEIESWNPALILIASDDAARDVVEQICVNSQFRERPIVMFTEDDDPVAMRAAMQARVSAYVVAGMQPNRLRSVIDVALERFKQDQLQLAQIDAARRVAETDATRERVVAQAKALLRRRGMTEPDAYAMLRTQAMRERCSLADVAKRVLAGA